MKIWATHSYENTFEMEVPAHATKEEIVQMIIEEDEYLGGTWMTDYEISEEWEDE